MSVALDAWAILAWLEDVEQVGQVVEALIGQRPSVAELTLAEVEAAASRHVPREQVAAAMASIAAACSVVPASDEVWRASAQCAAELGLPVTSAVALCTARALGQRLATGDPLLLAVAPAEDVDVLAQRSVQYP